MNNTISEFVTLALAEDIGAGDFTSLACVPSNKIAKAHLLVKQIGILSGVEVALEVFKQVDADLIIDTYINSGSAIQTGDIVLVVEGSAQSILKAERLALNFMQRMSGIATITAEFTALIAHTKCKLLDTRKTTPGFRVFEKIAVKDGGGENHRFGLYDMIMIKDNHVDYCGGIAQALSKVDAYLNANKLNLKVEIETRNLKELNEVLQSDVLPNRIMLDNYSVSDLSKAIQIIAGKTETEASGGITEKTLKEYAETGVDFISTGAITHSYKSLDLSLKAI